MTVSKLPIYLRVALSLLSLAVFVTIAEVAVRLARVDTTFQNRLFTLNRNLDYPDVFLRDRDLFWRFRPGQVITSEFFDGKTYRINSSGLRGEEIAPRKTKPRVIAFGNSCTFGWGIPYEDTYPARLEMMLEGAYEVINAGIPGYTTLQAKRFFERDLGRLQPDVVLLLFAWNDHWAAAHQIADKDQQFPPAAIITVQNLLSRSHAYCLLKKLLLATIEPDRDSVVDRSAVVYRVGPDDFRGNLQELCRLARAAGATPVLLTSPIPSLTTYYPPGAISPMHRFHNLYNDVIRDLARVDRVDLVDLALEFDRYSDLFDRAADDPIHFNAKGHQIAAEMLNAYLREHHPPAAVPR
ncbi:MAG TPA: SGNH/GDSL hydrolase family protein [Candidatus Deferrimicrobium sp.]|nr:SGNH/GDSL hydrolase family protein [Candidatus Deferrimicrobium sp.]